MRGLSRNSPSTFTPTNTSLTSIEPSGTPLSTTLSSKVAAYEGYVTLSVWLPMTVLFFIVVLLLALGMLIVHRRVQTLRGAINLKQSGSKSKGRSLKSTSILENNHSSTSKKNTFCDNQQKNLEESSCSKLEFAIELETKESRESPSGKEPYMPEMFSKPYESVRIIKTSQSRKNSESHTVPSDYYNEIEIFNDVQADMRKNNLIKDASNLECPMQENSEQFSSTSTKEVVENTLYSSIMPDDERDVSRKDHRTVAIQIENEIYGSFQHKDDIFALGARKLERGSDQEHSVYARSRNRPSVGESNIVLVKSAKGSNTKLSLDDHTCTASTDDRECLHKAADEEIVKRERLTSQSMFYCQTEDGVTPCHIEVVLLKH